MLAFAALLVANRTSAQAQEGAWASEPTPAQAPPITARYVQYGVGLGPETIFETGEICPADAGAPCILGSGVGIAVRVGYRSPGHWYLGGAYAFSRHDTNNLVRLAILQQLRAEGRYYFTRHFRANPLLEFGGGAAVFGNEWGVSTGGPTGFIGGGVEFQASRTSLVVATLGHRVLALRRWEDRTGTLRGDGLLGFGFAHVLSLEIAFELRRPLARW